MNLENMNWPQKAKEKVQEALDKVLDRDSDLTECTDNFRFACENSSDENMEYENIRSGGCCGYYDSHIEFEGNIYYFGFNYGH